MNQAGYKRKQVPTQWAIPQLPLERTASADIVWADTLMHASSVEQANSKIELALKLNAIAPDAYRWASAGIKFFISDYEGALNHLSRVKNSGPVLRLTAACTAMAGLQELARLANNRFLSIDPGFRQDDWIAVYL